MSNSQKLYEECKRLESENEVLRLRRENDRLKQEAQSTIILDGVAAVFEGDAFFEVIPGNVGWMISFRKHS